MPRHEGAQIQRHWESLDPSGQASVWKELADEFTADAAQFGERHYKEFVTFLPYVQRFLYGEGGADDAGSGFGLSSIRVFRRDDVAQARIVFPGEPQPTVFDVAHVDLYFFYDIDIAILVVEIFAENLTLATTLNALYRFGRTYPDALGAERARRPLRRARRMARPRRRDPRRVGLRAQREIPVVRVPAPRAVRRIALALTSSSRWCCTTPISAAKSATARSSISACR